MSLHDKLAQEAIAMTKHSSEFSAAAQKQADATWFYLIVAGALWYFFDWLWALIPAALGIYTAFQSISATMVTTRIERQESNLKVPCTDLVLVVQRNFKARIAEIGFVAKSPNVAFVPIWLVNSPLGTRQRYVFSQQLKGETKC